MTLVDAIGYSAAVLGIAMLAVQTMVPLRMTGIAKDVASITFGLLSGAYPLVLQHAILLPVNGYRLYEMLRLVKRVKAAAAEDHNMDWLKPFMTKHSFKAGEILFKKGDDADRMYFVVSGRMHLPEIGIDVLPGAIVGELGMLSPGGKRTASLACAEDSVLLELSYTRIEELYYQNPTFGFYFLRVSSERLFDNIGRLEEKLAERDAEIARLRAALATRGVSQA